MFGGFGPTHHSGLSIRLREVLLRTKAFLDLYIMGTTPKFLGPKEPIQPNPKQESSPDSSPIADPADTDVWNLHILNSVLTSHCYTKTHQRLY